MFLYHNSRDTDYRTPFGAVETGTEIKLSVLASYNEEDKAKSVWLRLWLNDSEKLVEMTKASSFDIAEVSGAADSSAYGIAGGSDAGNSSAYGGADTAYGILADRELYTATITMPDEGCLVWYYFYADMPWGRTYYGNNEQNLGGIGQQYDHEPPSFQITCYKHAKVPEWYKDGIVYQIFPDRFARDEAWEERCNAEIAANEGHAGQHKFIEPDWYKPAYYVKDWQGKVTDWPFYGGSFKGIEGKLSYLKMLGVTAIYLNPIVKATSNHRYDAGDFMKIDPMLGTEDDFRDLVKSAGEQGIKIILDGVFSHTGADSLYFDKYGNYGGQGAYNNPDSEYRSWYDFGPDYEIGYRAWWGVEDLPEIEEEDPSYAQMICGDDGVIAHWMDLGASGLRLDVADELPDDFIKQIRARIKKENPDALLMGEVWEDASNKQAYGVTREYFLGEELDSTMHYPLRTILIDYALGRIDAREAENRLMSLQENYPKENFYGTLNLIGSHDRERILTVLGVNEDYNRASKRLKMLSALQYALPGVPCIYYGDEVGMQGGADPENRNGFPWEHENGDIQYHYRMLGLLYEEHPVLKDGDLRFVDVGGDSDVLAFVREYGGKDNEKILVLVNRSEQSKMVEIGRATEGASYGLELLRSNEVGLKQVTSSESEAAMPGAAFDGQGIDDGGQESQPYELGPLEVKLILLKAARPKGYEMDRSAGVLCHVSSIPGRNIGRAGRAFVDYIASAGMKLWQILPLNPPGMGNSPYSSNAAFAGDARLIDPEELPDMSGFDRFCEQNASWLEDYVAYIALKESFEDKPWSEWPDDAPHNGAELLSSNYATQEVLARALDLKIEQYYFQAQWTKLRDYANSKGIEIIGDLPIFVSQDSADAWACRDAFLMNDEGELTCHAGVPADYFSPEGQNWGNPLYDWDSLRSRNYDWWVRRLDQCRQRYDYVRLDHFRSFSEFFAIPEGHKPVDGRWRHGPGLGFFKSIEEQLGNESGRPIRILAEDLGALDNGVFNLMDLTGYPGMNIWQFSADEMMAMTEKDTARRVFYTGTHDNQTLYGWCLDKVQGEMPDREQPGSIDEGTEATCDQRPSEDESRRASDDAHDIISHIYESSAPWAIVQLQDMFLLGDESRINVPGTVGENWTWHIEGDSIESVLVSAGEVAASFRELATKSGRL